MLCKMKSIIFFVSDVPQQVRIDVCLPVCTTRQLNERVVVGMHIAFSPRQNESHNQ